MALDHYVSQVHLRKFYSPELNQKKMYCTRKTTLDTFRCGSEDVCRIQEGSTNLYLNEQRLVEQFLKQVEPSYNRAINSFREGNLDADSVFAIAGFVSYILTCSPTSMRLNSKWLEKSVESTARLLDKTGVYDDPEEL